MWYIENDFMKQFIYTVNSTTFIAFANSVKKTFIYLFFEEEGGAKKQSIKSKSTGKCD